MQIDLQKKRVLVTGGNTGIGKAIALAMAKANARVAINYIVQPENAEAVAQEIQKLGSESLTLKADISQPDEVADMFTQMDDVWGGIDILVNNAGIDGKRNDTWDIAVEDWERVLKINLFGAFHCSREALKRLVPQKSGVVLNISSVHEVIAWSGYSAYTASKAGLSMFTKSMAQEAAPHGVRVLALAPGAVKTPINKAVWENAAQNQDLMQKIPLGRIGEPEEIANMAVVLVSDAASYVTATTIFVDGGMTDFPDFAHGG